MPVETATYISDLNPAYPGSNDTRKEGDDHLRLIKQTLKNTFPNVNGAVSASPTDLDRTKPEVIFFWSQA